MKSLAHFVTPLLAVVALSLSCGEDRSKEPVEREIPPPDTSERAQRDSARVAYIVESYFRFLNRDQIHKAAEFFYPDSILVGTPGGGVIVEGKSAAAYREMQQDLELADFHEIEILRRVEKELLEESYREHWLLRIKLADPDSTRVERIIHIIQRLGSDERLLGRMNPELDSSTP